MACLFLYLDKTHNLLLLFTMTFSSMGICGRIVSSSTLMNYFYMHCNIRIQSYCYGLYCIFQHVYFSL